MSTGPALAALLVALSGALLGALGPRLIGALPEPAPEPAPEPGPEPAPDDGPAPEDLPAPGEEAAEPKVSYAELAGGPGLAWRLGLAAAVTGAVVGWGIGWQPGLLVWAPLTPVLVVLAYVDARTRLLPKRIVIPAYPVVGVLVVLASLLEPHPVPALVHAVVGWLVMFLCYALLWFVHSGGLGYGDVRLSGVLGMALGQLGLAEMLTGWYAGFLIGGVGGVLLKLAHRTHGRLFPFGPFMVAGAVAGVLLGRAVTAWWFGLGT